ncbi:hypothetical protein [Paenibacillus sp. y28]|uniref:hypothetical protein n=1 Tax=Paenibacillus sp. y28 TaxID=3129110 RepID=UPI003018B644
MMNRDVLVQPLADADRELAEAVAPVLCFDRAEPFYPVRVGVTVLREAGPSPSFRRSFAFHDSQLAAIVEYAIYWDYDIQHLYELEHVWVYVGRDGQVLDCEASFHGKFLRGLWQDRRNLVENRHVRLYSQPGKHAFLPDPGLFELVPGFLEACGVNAGLDGVTVPAMIQDRVKVGDSDHRLVRSYLQTLAFEPAMVFEEYRIPQELLVSWPALLAEIPERLEAELEKLRKQDSMGDKE